MVLEVQTLDEETARSYVRRHSVGELMEELAAAVILELPDDLEPFLVRLLAFRMLEERRAAALGSGSVPKVAGFASRYFDALSRRLGDQAAEERRLRENRGSKIDSGEKKGEKKGEKVNNDAEDIITRGNDVPPVTTPAGATKEAKNDAGPVRKAVTPKGQAVSKPVATVTKKAEPAKSKAVVNTKSAVAAVAKKAAEPAKKVVADPKGTPAASATSATSPKPAATVAPAKDSSKVPATKKTKEATNVKPLTQEPDATKATTPETQPTPKGDGKTDTATATATATPTVTVEANGQSSSSSSSSPVVDDENNRESHRTNTSSRVPSLPPLPAAPSVTAYSEDTFESESAYGGGVGGNDSHHDDDDIDDGDDDVNDGENDDVDDVQHNNGSAVALENEQDAISGRDAVMDGVIDTHPAEAVERDQEPHGDSDTTDRIDPSGTVAQPQPPNDVSQPPLTNDRRSPTEMPSPPEVAQATAPDAAEASMQLEDFDDDLLAAQSHGDLDLAAGGTVFSSPSRDAVLPSERLDNATRKAILNLLGVDRFPPSFCQGFSPQDPALLVDHSDGEHNRTLMRDVTRWGIVQNEGGPCGVLAALNARLAVCLHGARSSINQSHERLDLTWRRALSFAVADTLLACSPDGATCAVVCGGEHGDGAHCNAATLVGASVYTSKGRKETASLVERVALRRWAGPSDACEGGVSMLVASAIVTRGGPEMVRSDFDTLGEASLIGRHGYCTQELVNLLLTGRATSNVFDGSRVLEGGGDVNLLGVIPRRCEIGFLSLFEHYGSIEVGSRYKTPRNPVWVVCSESHFSVLLAMPDAGTGLWTCGEDAVADWAESIDEAALVFSYYDQLARPPTGDGIVLTVNPAAKNRVGSKSTAPGGGEDDNDGQLVPPINLVIGTRWPGAEVNWSCDPHL